MFVPRICSAFVAGALAIEFIALIGTAANAEVGDPQLRTDHQWYPGELACSTFERLFATQAELFERVTGQPPQTDQDRALAAWMWRNAHYAHGEGGVEDLWGHGFRSPNNTTREYWTGLFAHGFGLCGTTHAQWTAELNALLGPGRSRTVGVTGHNACEVFLTGGPYAAGRWALLDHDVSTVIFDPAGIRLMSIDEIRRDLQRLTDPAYAPQRQHGWPLGGLHRDDPQAYSQFNVVEHLPGYAGPPPRVHLRRGETLRRYYQPGLEDGETFVFWGRNYRVNGIPGPERSRTWVNQPERFRNSPDGTGFQPGQARYGNAVFTWQPDFTDGSYREGIVREGNDEVIFEFQSPYIIAASPASDADWGIYDPGCHQGLVVAGDGKIPVSVSVDRGTTWHDGGLLAGTVDLTDAVKGYRQYWIKFGQPAARLAAADLKIVTVCQANPATFPRLKSEGSSVTYAASGQGLVSAGPTRRQAEAHLIDGALDTPRVALTLNTPRGESATHLYAAAHVASSNPPDPEIRYRIEFSLDAGRTWQSLVKDWHIQRQGVEPPDFWSQSFCYGDIPLPPETTGPVQIRFRNDGGKSYLRAEAHLTYTVPQTDDCRITFAWSDDRGIDRTAIHTVIGAATDTWTVDTGREVQMRWVVLESIPSSGPR